MGAVRYISGSSEYGFMATIRTGLGRNAMDAKALTVDSQATLTPEQRAAKIQPDGARLSGGSSHRTWTDVQHDIAEAIRDALEAGRKRDSELLEHASEFYFQGSDKDLAVAARFNNRDEGPEVRWVVHEAGKPNPLVNVRGDWEIQTEESYQDDAFINRTRMSLDEAFALVKRSLAAQV